MNITPFGEIKSGKLTKANALDAGLDIYASECLTVPSRGSKLVRTGLVIAVPVGHVGLIWPRSGLSVKSNIETGAGCIDSEYRGEVMVHLYNHGDMPFMVEPGDRIAQLLTIPVNLNLYRPVEEFSDSDTPRGAGGFGSTGR